ncbi:uncharacterized protein TNCT_369501 [Trichonephila clavata]|uniref:Uncharacterized protein n=1 Tax=Trichonephila clavata TaxID=2740835 RepID=A0A8X6F5B3_TRICU|nr:uncharacterized protein TNCT_369501 [Trichonephila clavata]
MAFFDRLPVLPLRQMALTKVAINVCLDPEILDFVKINGCASFVFPSKETHLYLGVKSPKEETWIWKDFLKECVSDFCALFKLRNVPECADCVTRKNILPFARWEELVEEKISSLPKLLQRELLDMLRSVSIEMDMWTKEHSKYWREFSEIVCCFQHDFQWNSLGKIDRWRTARKLIINERVDILARNILASLYSLMEMLPIKDKLPDEIVEKYSDFPEEDEEWSTRTSFCDIQFYYTIQKDEFIAANSSGKMMFIKCLLRMDCLQYEDFLFFMSHMDEDKRKYIFEVYAFKILWLFFLKWPLQCMFLNAAEQLLPYFTQSDFRDMLISIIYERIMLGWKDFNYIDLLKGFWSLSPSKLKESIKTDSIYEPLMLIINFPVGEMFPNEQLLENYNGDVLTFSYDGFKYHLGKNGIRIEDFKITNLFDPPRLFINLFIFDKDLKIK